MNVFLRPFIKKTANPKDEKVRESCGKRAGIFCIIVNSLLALAKILLGAFSGAVSVLADGFNNLTDCGSNVVSVIGFKMSGKPADKEHPFGHQRAESISALLISAIIIVVAIELAISSVNKIVKPEKSVFSVWLLVILCVSVVAKLIMFAINKALGKLTDSENLSATALDSISDAAATSVVLIALIVSHYANVELDGYAGILVALFIAFTGFGLLKETVSKLLGKAPDKSVIKDIIDRINKFDGVHGIHDLAVHCYGQNRMYATVHVEIDSSTPIMQSHELADDIEKDFAEHTNVILTVHIDPLVLNDPIINELNTTTQNVVREISENFHVHDFRVVGGEIHSNLIFDVAVPFDEKRTDKEIEDAIRLKIFEWNKNYGVVMTVERQNLD